MPASIKDLTGPKWKSKIAFAPTSPGFIAQLDILMHLWGKEATTDWLNKFLANDPIAYYPANAKEAHFMSTELLRAVSQKEALLTPTTTRGYYLFKVKNPDAHIEMYSYPNPHDAGNVLLFTGAAINKQSSKKVQAEKLIEFLISPTTQNYFVEKLYGYPVLKNFPANKDLPPLEKVSLAKVDPAWLDDNVEPVIELLQKLKENKKL